MLMSKKMKLKPLLESSGGVHLTVYLVNRGKPTELKSQLLEMIVRADEWLTPVLAFDERKKFLEPLDSLLKDARVFKEMKKNIGIFRNQNYFRVLNVPVDVEQTCQVATTFHVKPLLRWLQADQEFLLLGLEQDAAHLYLGSQESLKRVDSISFHEGLNNEKFFGHDSNYKPAQKMNIKEDNLFGWLNDWILQKTKDSKHKMFIAGDSTLVDDFNRSLKYHNVVKPSVANFFNKNDIRVISSAIREIQKSEAKSAIKKALIEFRFAEEDNRVRKNIFLISKAVVQGRVRKLIVANEQNIFGKIDKKSGGLAIHPFDLDHEDDDILDDLAQMVLKQGGEVVVASRNEIPKGRSILAILEQDAKELETIKNTFEYQVHQERLG